MVNVEINTEYITLGQMLKAADIVSTGGQVKPFLQEAVITVNGESENRRGKKLRNGDIVNIEGVGEFHVIQS